MSKPKYSEGAVMMKEKGAPDHWITRPCLRFILKHGYSREPRSRPISQATPKLMLYHTRKNRDQPIKAPAMMYTAITIAVHARRMFVFDFNGATSIISATDAPIPTN